MKVTGIFHWLNTSGLTMALGSTQPLTEIYLVGGKGGQCVGLTTLPPSCADRLDILETSTSCRPKGLSRPVHGLLYHYCRSMLLQNRAKQGRVNDGSTVFTFSRLYTDAVSTTVVSYSSKIKNNK